MNYRCAFVPRRARLSQQLGNTVLTASLGQACACPRKHVLYGASRSASDATSLVYTTTSVLRGRRTPPFGSVGSCVASYRLFLDSILVKVFASVTKNRDVSLLC